MEDVKLVGLWASPFSRRIEISLKLKGIEYEFIEQNPFDKSSTLVKYNPIHKKIPVFLHNGKPIVESLCLPEMQKLGYGSKEEKEKARDELSKLLKILDNEVKDKKFFGGETVGFVDFVSILITYWLGVIQEALQVEVLTNDEFPNICVWGEELQSCSIIKENLPEKNYLELTKLSSKLVELPNENINSLHICIWI
ncbi:hypothetical protein HAX54_002308 [Datura stramonium]|uniref:Glutathione S-transferase n=1 Tax=Datura stramonium TaxID=4076 RepID=A0ABS8T5U4_DATST|nr:hypothetical protein [Datura stramonium]